MAATEAYVGTCALATSSSCGVGKEGSEAIGPLGEKIVDVVASVDGGLEELLGSRVGLADGARDGDDEGLIYPP